MNDINFFSSSSYIFLPTKNNPKVALAIDNTALSRNSFKLYNPFSSKAKLLKQVVEFSYLNLNNISKIFSKREEKSDFVIYLEKLLKQSLVVSIYFATIYDKVVLQLQSVDAKILGYIKYPLNEIGLKHIQNEIKAYEMLSSLNIIEPYILYDEYEGKPFLFLKELDGDIGVVEDKYICKIVDKFKRESSYSLANHPRVEEIKKLLIKNSMQEYLAKVDEIVDSSSVKYKVVYEHGDFAPWNILKVEEKYIPFDFEYFVEDGLEYFDLIKYYYQIGSFLKKKKRYDLKEYVCAKVGIQDIEYIYELYLIKENTLKKLEK